MQKIAKIIGENGCCFLALLQSVIVLHYLIGLYLITNRSNNMKTITYQTD